MQKEIYRRAKYLMQGIGKIDSQIYLVEKMKARTNDDEFNDLRKIAHQALSEVKATLQKEFDAL